jgi:hypothetical protein
LEHLFFGIVGLVLLHLVYQIIKNRGLRGAMFGAPVIRTIGELDLGRRGMVRTRLKVHRLQGTDTASPVVGIEFLMTTLGSFGMTPLPLTRDQALTLSGLLSRAAAEAGSGT